MISIYICLNNCYTLGTIKLKLHPKRRILSVLGFYIMQLLGKRVALKATEKESLIITANEYDFEVAYIGSEVTKVKVGDKVYQQFGTKAKVNGEEAYLIMEDDIIAII